MINRGLTMVVAGVAFPAVALAAFDVSVSPPRFELGAKPGEVTRQVLSISNGSAASVRYDIRTADWELDAKGGVQFQEGAPGPASCRPWVRIERHQIVVGAKDTRDYRFEVHVPPGAPSGECRFALLISSEAMVVQPSGNNKLQLPIQGRMGVVVYIAVGSAKPEMKLLGIETRKVNGKLIPVATFQNSGNAHGRVSGSLEALDSGKHKLELVSDESVILPRSTRTINLNPVDWSSGESKEPAYTLTLPMHIRGSLQYLGGGSIKVDQVLR